MQEKRIRIIALEAYVGVSDLGNRSKCNNLRMKEMSDSITELEKYTFKHIMEIAYIFFYKGLSF